MRIFFLLFIGTTAIAQTLAPLTVEKIMRDPKWIGVSPSNLNWAENSKDLFFDWNPDKNPGDSLYTISITNRIPQKVNPSSRRVMPSFNGSYNRTFTKKLYAKDGDLFLLNVLT